MAQTKAPAGPYVATNTSGYVYVSNAPGAEIDDRAASGAAAESLPRR